MATRCLVYGANSFMGSNFVEYALENTDWVLLCSTRSNDDRLSDVITPYMDSRVWVYDNHLPTDLKVDIIVNFASQARPRLSLEQPMATIMDNTRLMVDLLEYARMVKPKLFIHISTTDIADPITPYAASKKMQEEICYSYRRSYNLPIVIVRPTNTYGKRQSADNFIPFCIKSILNDEIIKIYGPNDNVGSRYYVHAWDIASEICSMGREKFYKVVADQPKELLAFDIANLTHSESSFAANTPIRQKYTHLEIALIVSDVLRKATKIEMVDPPEFYKPEQMLPLTERVFIPVAKYTSEESLRETIKWAAENQEWL